LFKKEKSKGVVAQLGAILALPQPLDLLSDHGPNFSELCKQQKNKTLAFRKEDVVSTMLAKSRDIR
jgi:hypothetical protein